MAEPCRGCSEREKNPDWFLNTVLLPDNALRAGPRGQHQAGFVEHTAGLTPGAFPQHTGSRQETSWGQGDRGTGICTCRKMLCPGGT